MSSPMSGYDYFGLRSESSGALEVSKNAKIVLGVVIAVIVAAALGLGVWVAVDTYKNKQLQKKIASLSAAGNTAAAGGAAAPSLAGASYAGSGMTATHPSVRTNKSQAAPKSSDPSTCYNENLIGSYAIGVDSRSGSVRPAFSKMPMAGKAVPLTTNQGVGASKLRSNGSLGRQTPIDLSGYARLGLDRALGASGLDRPGR